MGLAITGHILHVKLYSVQDMTHYKCQPPRQPVPWTERTLSGRNPGKLIEVALLQGDFYAAAREGDHLQL